MGSSIRLFTFLVLILCSHPRRCAQNTSIPTEVDPSSRSAESPNGMLDSCSDIPHTDKALLRVDANSQPFWVLCVQQHHLAGNGWLVILQRRDNTAFNRDWIAYREGFGQMDGSFWLGLEKIHQLTSTTRHELLVEVADFRGNTKYARYTRFAIGEESEKYVLEQLGSYSGSAGDGLRIHLGMKFTTIDDDNDRSKDSNCALTYTGGWWYDYCFVNGSHLTGTYNVKNSTTGIIWWPFSNPWETLMYARMMIRKLL